MTLRISYNFFQWAFLHQRHRLVFGEGKQHYEGYYGFDFFLEKTCFVAWSIPEINFLGMSIDLIGVGNFLWEYIYRDYPEYRDHES